ncbi:MAG: ribosome assembly cofactor RimP [Bacteroidales bacterium]|nr:ribosome assembly cofactor RimP [Candidatus Equibacterium intestinale]
MKQQDILKQAAEEYTASHGLYVVEIKVTADNDIDITIEADERDIALDDCVDMTRYIEERVSRDVEDYSLTIGSAGLTSPFKVNRQYKKSVGSEIQITRGTGARQKVMLAAVSEDGIDVTYGQSRAVEGSKKKVKETVTEHIPFSEIKSAKPVIKFE